MPTFILKSYQQAALNQLKAFLQAAQRTGAARAFGALVGRTYQSEPFGEVPSVCLRIPTGGGKTLLAAHAVPLLAAQWRATDALVAVWLVAAVEYKGAHLLSDPYEIEKRQVGELWARKAQGRCLFGYITKNRDGQDMAAQLKARLA